MRIGTVLSLMTDPEDEGHDVRRRLEWVVARPALLSPKRPRKPTCRYRRNQEQAAGDPEKAAGLTDVPGDLFVVMDPTKPNLRPPQLLLFSLAFSHVGPPRGEIEPVHGESY